jgi:hypothetical protein
MAKADREVLFEKVALHRRFAVLCKRPDRLEAREVKTPLPMAIVNKYR